MAEEQKINDPILESMKKDPLGSILLKAIGKKRGIDIIGSGCVPIDELQKYQNNSRCLHGWCCVGALRFDTPKSLEEFGLKRPPQSWQFTEVEV